MKRLYIILLSFAGIAAFAFIALWAFYRLPRTTAYSSPEISWTSEARIDTLEQLESKAAVIAKVTVFPGSRQTLSDVGSLGHTITPVRIDILYKKDEKAKERGTVHIFEYYSKTYTLNKIYVMTMDDYMPMVPGEQYILFLIRASHREDGGEYETISIKMGKYSYSDKIKNASKVTDLSKEDMEILYDAFKDFLYWNVAQSVKEKYIR